MADEKDLQTGDLSGKSLGQYEIGRQLGQGGMATVYMAQQKSIGRTVAIKVMPQHFLHDPSFLQRFEREVKVIAALQHPRVLPVYDYGQIENRPYIVMAYMSGGTLADKIHEGPLPLAQIVRLTDQIAEGLDHAHRKGIIHRDFKPSNVLLDENGNAHLADFGIAKITESTAQLTGSGIVGTPAYMAPEMAEKGDVSSSIDIYALGVTLFQMLTGKYPFQGDTPIRVMMAHASDPIPDVRELRADLPEAITEVVKKAMAKRPENRYATATDLASDLKQAAQGFQPGAAPEELRTIGLGPAPAQRPATPPPPSRPAVGFTEAPSSTPPSLPTPYMSAPQPVSTAPPPIYSTPYPPVQPKKRGCSPGLIIGIAVGGIALLCIGAVLAFGGLATLGSFLSTETPVPTPTPEKPTVVNLTVDNQSGATICYLYISVDISDEWGDDQLGTDGSIDAGQSYTFEDIEPGTYDIRAEDCEGNIIADEYSLDMTAGDQIWEVPADMASLTVINDSSYPLCELYVVETDSDDWGQNQLDSGQTIEPGSQYTLSNIPYGSYNLRAVTCDSNWEYTLLDTAFSGPLEWPLTDE